MRKSALKLAVAKLWHKLLSNPRSSSGKDLRLSRGRPGFDSRSGRKLFFGQKYFLSSGILAYMPNVQLAMKYLQNIHSFNIAIM